MVPNIQNTEILAELAVFFKKKSDILLVFLFGSAARGDLIKDSDIDIALLYEKFPTINEINQQKNALNAVFKRDIDIAVLNSASPILKMQVLKNGILAFVGDQRNYYRFFVDTLNQYDDLKQVRKVCEDNVLKGRIYA